MGIYALQEVYMKKLILLIGLMLLLVSCKSNTIKIGFAGSLSGQYFELGMASKNGFELAIEKINKNGGINGMKIIPVIKDDESNLERAHEIINEFAKEEVKYIVGLGTSNMTPVILKALAEYDMLFVSPTMSTPLLAQKDDNFIRVTETHLIEVKRISQFLSDNLEARKISVILDLDNEAYSKSYYENLVKDFEEFGGTTLKAYELTGDDRNYNEVCTNILKDDSDALVLITNTTDASNILQNLSKLNYSNPIIASGWCATNELITHSGQTAEGVYSIRTTTTDPNREEYKEFMSRYDEKYREVPSFASFLAYDSVQVLTEGLNKTNSLDTVDVKNSIIAIKDFTGVEINFLIDEYGECDRKRFLSQIIDGEFIVIDE